MKCDITDKKNSKIRQLLDYFNYNIPSDTENTKYRRAIKLEKMIRLYNSDLIEIRKIDEMSKIFKSSSSFMENYEDLMPYIDDLNVGYFANAVKIIGNYYKTVEENGLKDKSKDLLEIEENKYFEDYSYACYFVEEYIKYDNSPFLVDFLKEYNLREMTFNRFVDIVAELNGSLYGEYCIKKESNREMRKSAAIRKVEEIKYGVIGETLENGEKYDALDYYSNFPFYSIETTKELLDDFGIKKGVNLNQNIKILMRHIEPENIDLILDYIGRNNLYFSNYPVEIKKESILNTKYIINGRELTDEDKDNIVRYMENRGIPFVIDTFTIVKNRYAKNELDIDKKLKLS